MLKKRFVGVALLTLLVGSQAFAATTCRLMAFEEKSSGTVDLKVTEQNELSTTLTATVGNISARVKLMQIVGDNPMKAPVGHLEAAIIKDKKLASQMITDSLNKAGDSFLVDVQGARLICEL